MGKENKRALAKELGISRASLYYRKIQPRKDWELKVEIEKVLRVHPSYGHKRLALHLNVNKKRTLRVMKLFGIKPYRRRGGKWRKSIPNSAPCPNLLLEHFPSIPHEIWVADFTHVNFQSKVVYIATVMDLYSRRIVGFNVLLNHSVQLIIGALFMAIHRYPVPKIFHSDQGSEYASEDFQNILRELGIRQSMSKKASPWENGYQESFYCHFKVDLGDPNRFKTLGELVYEIYQTIHIYNTTRIHTALKTSPQTFALSHQLSYLENSV